MSKSQLPTVLFNASVILAGLKTHTGGSGKLLSWVRGQKINGVISDIILDEALRNASNIKMASEEVAQKIKRIFKKIAKEPGQEVVEQFSKKVIEVGDAHVLASAKEEGTQFLVTLDKKHLLVLRSKITDFKIVTPGQLIAILSA